MSDIHRLTGALSMLNYRLQSGIVIHQGHSQKKKYDRQMFAVVYFPLQKKPQKQKPLAWTLLHVAVHAMGHCFCCLFCCSLKGYSESHCCETLWELPPEIALVESPLIETWNSENSHDAWEARLISVKHEFKKLFFRTHDLKVLLDPWRTWIINRYFWFYHSILRDFDVFGRRSFCIIEDVKGLW